MFRKLFAVVIAAAMFAVTGCIDSTTVVKVKKDGSGIIVESVYFGKAFIQMMQQMTAQMGGKPEAPGAAKPFDPPLEVEKYKSKAEQMGEGVTYQSAKKVQKSDGSPGVQVIYAFTDINKLKLSMQDAGGGAGGPGMGGAQEAKDPITFQMAKAAKPKLVIIMPKPDKAKGAEGKAPAVADAGKTPPEPPPEQMAQMKQMFDGLRMRLAVMVDGKITKSNATYQEKDKDGNSHIVTLFDMNFGKLISDEAAFKKLAAMGDVQDMAVVKEKLKGIDGIKAETAEKVEVEFE